MKLSPITPVLACVALLCSATIGLSQSPEKSETNAIRVTVSMNADGSRTVYEFDDAQHKAVATITGQDGKVREKIHYDIDDLGRFSSGTIFGPDGRFRFKSRYKYDSAGRLQEETQSAQDDTLLHKIVYNYDQNGKQTGYSIFDGSGKLLGRTTVSGVSASPPAKSRGKRSR
jgi:YD repeat-containing protein